MRKHVEFYFYNTKERYELKFAIYSVTYAGTWYNDVALSVEELISRAAECGYDGIEIDGKRPHGFALDWSSRRREEVRRLAEEKGIEIVGVAANNNFVSPIPERRESEMLAVSELIKLAHDLGAPIVRIFAAWQGMTIENGLGSYEIARADRYQYPAVRLNQWAWCKDCISEVAKVAEQYNVTLSLQNHKPLIRNYRDMLDMVHEVSLEHVKCSLDAPLLDCQEDAYVAKAVNETGNLEVISHFGGEFEKNSRGEVSQKDLGADGGLFNYPSFVRALDEIGYDGYLSYELCHPFLPDGHKPGNLSQVHQQVEYALAYMKRITGERRR
jgi:sugar phosphate isomerase/epimerase